MDKQNVHQPKRSKQRKKKKNPIKVVYISNPVKVNVSAAEFMARVQELTGQGSDPTELTKFSDSQAAREISKVPVRDTGEPDSTNLSRSIASDGVACSGQDAPLLPDNSVYPFEFFGDIFAHQMVDGFAGLLPFPLCS